MTKGYICVIQNNKSTDYLKLAYALSLSIKNTQTWVSNLSIITDIPISKIPKKYQKSFDHIIKIKNDRAKDKEWKLHNVVDIYDLSPYDETVLLDSDELFLSDVSHWWTSLEKKDIWFTTHTKTYTGELAPLNTIYRQEFIKNKLPNLYVAFFYFKKTEQVKELFELTKLICENWDYYTNKYLFQQKPKIFSTDVAFSLAVKLLGMKNEATEFEMSFPYFTHMKSQNQNWSFLNYKIDEDWTKYADYSFNKIGLKINTIRQQGIFHYHIKTFLNDEIIKILENNS